MPVMIAVETWDLAHAADGVDGLVHHPTEETTLFINDGQHENYWSYKGARPAKLLKSTDAGKTWTELAASMAARSTSIRTNPTSCS
jgi:hypothetical protein